MAHDSQKLASIDQDAERSASDAPRSGWIAALEPDGTILVDWEGNEAGPLPAQWPDGPHAAPGDGRSRRAQPRSHGTRMEVDQRIPWYAWGANARRGRTHRNVHTTDTAATALSALGLKLPDHIHGQPVTEAIGGTSPVGMPLVGNAVEAL
ncbi:MAG: hypothetical protein ACXW12_17715 [Burkholderiales bacterium]